MASQRIGRRSGSIVLLFVLVSSLATHSSAEVHKQIASANLHCDIKCLNGGYCSYAKYTDYPRKGDVGFYQACTCRPGFEGPACENAVKECQPPNYTCHNGAPCSVMEDGSLGCDCSAADKKSDLVGYMCKKPMLFTSCDTLDEDNKSFCTNGGVCLSSITAAPNHLMFAEPRTHEGCQCDSAFSGKHCELIRGMPRSTLATPLGVPRNERSAGAKAGVSLSVLAVVAICGAMIFAMWRKDKRLRLHADQSSTDRGNLHQIYMDGVVGTSGSDQDSNSAMGSSSDGDDNRTTVECGNDDGLIVGTINADTDFAESLTKSINADDEEFEMYEDDSDYYGESNTKIV